MADSETDSRTPTSTGHSFAVLFVDDEERSLKYFRKALQGRLTVYTADSVATALETLDQNGDRIAVLVTDQRMPEQTGIDLLRQVKARYPDTVRLLTSAYADQEATAAALNEGEVYRYIPKPWNDIDELRAVIGAAMELFLRRRRERDLLQAKRQTLLALASNIAHELRTPLAGIRAAARGLDRYLPQLLEGFRQHPDADETPIPPSHQELLAQLPKRLEQEVEQANLVIDLLLANVNLTNIDPQGFTTQSIAPCVERALARYPFTDRQRQLLQLDLEQDFLFHGSEPLLSFVLFNLVRNALYAIAAAGGEISIRLRQGRRHNRLLLRDTGTGIASEVLPHIFEDFFTTRSPGTGTGIGLPFCRRVAASFGGTIEARSELGAWSEFTIQLPTVEED